MVHYGVRVLISALLIVAASELGKRSALLGAILISLPLSSILALSFLNYDTGDSGQVIALAKGIVLMLIPSLAFFGLLVAFLKLGQNYWVALSLSCVGMALIYAGYAKVLGHFGITL